MYKTFHVYLYVFKFHLQNEAHQRNVFWLGCHDLFWYVIIVP